MRINKLFYLLLPSLCISLSGCNNKTTDSKTHVWYAYASENLISDWDYFTDEDEDNAKYKERDNTLRFNCMKNENEGVQLMISPDKDIDSFDFVLPDVSGDNGTITKDHFTVAAAYYMNVDFSNERTAESGLYPDALIPLENYKMRRMNYIEAGLSQSLYINLKTEIDTPAGEYKGVGKLILNNQTIDIPFEVKVYNATMPRENHVKSCYLIWYDQIANGEKKNAGPDMNMKYYNFALNKRLSVGELPPEYISLSNMDYFINNYLEKVVNDERSSMSRLPISNSNYSKDTLRTLFQKMIDKNLALRNQGDNETNIFKKAFIYMDDEPSPMTYQRVKDHDKDIFDLKKELSPQLVGYPELYESFTHIPNIVTTPYNETLVATDEEGGVECWCPQAQNFQTPEARAIYKARQNSTDREFGEHVWWYVCNDPTMPYPNYHLDAKVITSRVMRYMQYDYGIDGNLFWNICWYSKHQSGFTGPRDVWNDPISWESCAGDGMLVYPGLTFGVDGPITTLRLENILAGNEEYEYLYMINEKVNEYNTSKGTNYETNSLLQKYYSRLYTNMISNLDVLALENVRVELLSLIESLNSNLDAGMAILLK